MDESPVQDRIEELIDEGERLWMAAGDGDGMSPEDHRRLDGVRAELDQCWDALRRRRAGAPPAGPDDGPDAPNKLEGPEAEPPHLERGSPHSDEPAPDPGEPRDVP